MDIGVQNGRLGSRDLFRRWESTTFGPLDRAFGNLSSYGISNSLDGLLLGTLKTRFQVPPLWALPPAFRRMPAKLTLRVCCVPAIGPAFQPTLPLWPLRPLCHWLFKAFVFPGS